MATGQQQEAGTLPQHMMKLHPGGPVAPDTVLAPPGHIETDPTTRNVPHMLRLHIIDAQLPPGCQPYAIVRVGANHAKSKQLSAQDSLNLATTGLAHFDEQFVIEYDPRGAKDTDISVAFYDGRTNTLLGEWRTPVSSIDGSVGHTGVLHRLKDKLHLHHKKEEGHREPLESGSEVSWATMEGVQVPLTLVPSAYTTPAGMTIPSTTTTTTTGTAPTTAVPSTAATTTTATTATTGTTPLGVGHGAGYAHIRIRSEPKLIGTLRLRVRELTIPATGNYGPLHLNVKFSDSQRFVTPEVSGDANGRYLFDTSEFIINVDPTNNVRDVFIEVIGQGKVIGETRVTLYDTYRPGTLLASQPILIHETKGKIGEMLLTANFAGKIQKR